MIDTHCHLTDQRLLSQLDEVLHRAQAAGVTRMITIGTDLADDRAAIALCHGRENLLRCVVGIHPNYTQNATADDVVDLIELEQDPSVVALGEMGLDYFHKFADRAHQAKIFEAQLALAQQVNKPVVIHSREAIDDTLKMMANFSAVRAVFHCFTGAAAEADKILSAGYWISFTGPVTYKKNDALRDIVKAMPIDRLMVETDAPYLSPEPMRSHKNNEPALVMYTAAKVAEIKSISLGELDRITTANAQRFFGWGP